MKSASTTHEKNLNRPILVCLILFAVTAFTFAPVFRCEFLQFDDPDYVTENDWVKRGLTWAGVVQAFRDVQTANWHPLTWLSHMLDVQCFGLSPAGHHLTNLLLHMANAVLVFLVFRQLTGALWRSAFAAALFALHPLHVESVAWVSERKDVLSGFFFLLTLGAYAKYASGVRGQASGSGTGSPSRFYWLALLFFALGLMSKPMVVTLPFVLLLLDYWPLRRGPGVRGQVSAAESRTALPPPGGSLLALLREKIPFFALTVAACAVAYAAQAKAEAVTGVQNLPLDARLANAVTSYFIYLKKTVWPSDLAVFYPYTGAPGWPKLLLLVVLLVGLTVLLAKQAHRRPYLTVGWFWFTGMLVPVIGLVQVGAQSMADRYTYLPLIGVFVATAWGVADLIEHAQRGRKFLIAIVVAALAGCAATSWRQLGYWQNGVDLFRRALAVTPNNAFAHYNLGVALAARGQTEDAFEHFAEAVELEPEHGEALNNAGLCLVLEGHTEAGLDCYRKALAIKPDYPELRYNLGCALAANGDLPGAVEQFREAVRLRPRFADAHSKLGLTLIKMQKHAEAAIHFQLALEMRPDAQAYRNLGSALILLNDPVHAAMLYREALRLRPDWPEVLNLLAWLLATHGRQTVRDGAEALRLAERACSLSGRTNAHFLATLAAAYAENGRYREAVQTSQRSIKVATTAGQAEFAESERQRLGLYQANKPFHQE